MMQKKKFAILDAYEMQILKVFERGELKPVKESMDFKDIARNTLKKNKNLTGYSLPVPGRKSGDSFPPAVFRFRKGGKREK